MSASQAQALGRARALGQAQAQAQDRRPVSQARLPTVTPMAMPMPGAVRVQPNIRPPQPNIRPPQVTVPPVVDTFNVSLSGLQHWYADITDHVGILAAMQDDDANRTTFERALDHSLHQLVEAIRQRKKLIPDMPRDQLFDLNIMIGHALQLKIGVTRLGPGR